MYSVKQTQQEWLYFKHGKKKLTRGWNKYKRLAKRLTNKIMRRDGVDKHRYSGYEYYW